jgi:hypothetical protein
MSGNINTPNFPNQYPLNVMCNWTLPVTVNSSMMYLTVKSLDIQPGHTLTLQVIYFFLLVYVFVVLQT